MSWQDDIYNDAMARRAAKVAPGPSPATAYIIRQSSKALNKTETRFLNDYLLPLLSMKEIDEVGDHESVTLKLANGLRLSPDFPTWKDGRLTFYEVKGAFIREDARDKLKMAAGKYKQFRFVLCQYRNGVWAQQEVLP